MLLKEWAFLGNYDFYTNKLKVLATNELPPEKWSYAGKMISAFFEITFIIPSKNCGRREKRQTKKKSSRLSIWMKTQLASIPACMIRRDSRSIFTV